MTLAAIRNDVADFVGALITVYTLIILAYIVINLIFAFGARPGYYRWLDAFLKFVTQVTDPILNLFRRFLPPVRIGPGALDLAPMVATFVILILAGIVAGLIRG